MKTYVDENGRTIEARNYKEAAEKLYGQHRYNQPSPLGGTIPTTYCRRRLGYAEVLVFQVGDKQGGYWGVQTAIPQRHRLVVQR